MVTYDDAHQLRCPNAYASLERLSVITIKFCYLFRSFHIRQQQLARQRSVPTFVALLGNSSTMHAAVVMPTKPQNNSSYATDIRVQALAGLQSGSGSGAACCLGPLRFLYQVGDIQNETGCVCRRFDTSLAACTVLYCTVLCCNVLYCIVLHCTVLHCTVLYCTVLYCTAL
jgi:hypothetical protein